MDDADRLILSTSRRKATSGIALSFRSLLLLLDGRNLYHTRSNCHSSRNRRHHEAHYRNCRSRAVSIDGIRGRLCHSLNHLHGKHFFVRLVLGFGNLLLFLLLQLLDLVIVPFSKRNLPVILLLDAGSLNLQLSLHDGSQLLEDAAHARYKRIERTRYSLPEVRL